MTRHQRNFLRAMVRSNLEDVFLDVARGRVNAKNRSTHDRRCCHLFRPHRRNGATLHPTCCVQSWPRILEMVYWPAVQMLTWGFLQTYLVRAQGIAPNSAAIAAGTLIGAVLSVGYSLARPAGIFVLVSRRDVVAQHRQSADEPAATHRIRHCLDGDERSSGSPSASFRLRSWRSNFFGFNLWALGFAFAAFFVVLIVFAWSVRLVGFGNPSCATG